MLPGYRAPMKHLLLVIATALTLSPCGLRAQQPADPANLPGPELRAQETRERQNLCLGGWDDRKLIVAESRIENPFRETSRLGCETEGGTAVEMPDLPAPQSNPPRIA